MMSKAKSFTLKPNWIDDVVRVKEHLRQRVTEQAAPTYYDKYVKEALGKLKGLDVAQSIEDQSQSMGAETRASVFSAVEVLAECIHQMDAKRFVSHASRFLDTDVRNMELETVFNQGMGRSMTWNGLPLIKTCHDFSIISSLLAKEKPRTVFEIGSGSGASAMFMADVLQTQQIDAKVYSVDLKAVKAQHKGVTFIESDAMSPERVFPSELLEMAPHPWFIIDDAHTTIYKVLHHFYSFTKAGDYIFVEDSQLQQKEIGRFLMEVNNAFLVDTYYTDFFGRNCTSAVNSILVRTS